MNRKGIIRMAREAELYEDGQFFVCKHDELERFFQLVTEWEREQCAKVCEDLDAWNEYDPGSSAAMAIRARRQHEQS